MKTDAARQETSDVTVLLVQRAQEGDHAAFAELIDEHWAAGRRLARRLISDLNEIDDILQEATLAAYLNLRSLHSAERFSGWWYGIVLNHCRQYRRNIRRLPRFEILDDSRRSTADDLEAHVEDRALLADVARAVETLPAKQREVALLVCFFGFSGRDTAAALGISNSAVKVRLHRARQSLRAQFGATTSPEKKQRRRRPPMVELEVFDVTVRRTVKDGHEISNGVILLKEREGSRILPIWVGEAEATALALQLEGVETARPLTYHFAASLLEASQAKVQSATINKLVKDTFYATVSVEQGGRVAQVDARPSDAINLALRSGAPVFAEEEVLAQCPDRVRLTKSGAKGSVAIVQRLEELHRLANEVIKEEAPTSQDAWRELGVELQKDDS